MSTFTPRTEYVKAIYVGAVRNSFVASTSEIEQEFDRWLNGVVDSSWNEAVSAASETAQSEKYVDDEGYVDNVYNQAVEDVIRAINELNEA